ncbi:hypothetical protein FA15DRAFT_671995 [Coprinopsis marcescibilis]|uniref:Uncharacterized protein n=1 Tax=Coprinopsis marcescibilis TaxID=230819 RepID=A0A5C3KPP1_COPMA|nr:hypothetical protein FA15DRAFT_671995 [Coprinopsis marcescibilis]
MNIAFIPSLVVISQRPAAGRLPHSPSSSPVFHTSISASTWTPELGRRLGQPACAVLLRHEWTMSAPRCAAHTPPDHSTRTKFLLPYRRRRLHLISGDLQKHSDVLILSWFRRLGLHIPSCRVPR